MFILEKQKQLYFTILADELHTSFTHFTPNAKFAYKMIHHRHSLSNESKYISLIVFRFKFYRPFDRVLRNFLTYFPFLSNKMMKNAVAKQHL